MKNEFILWPLTSSKIIVLVAQPISTDGGPPAWAVNKRAELGWLSSRGKGWPAVCKSAPRSCSFTVRHFVCLKSFLEKGFPSLSQLFCSQNYEILRIIRASPAHIFPIISSHSTMHHQFVKLGTVSAKL